MLPALRRTLQEKYREPIFDYGDVEAPLDPKSWDTYAPFGWYGTNYVGLRGRMAILSDRPHSKEPGSCLAPNSRSTIGWRGAVSSLSCSKS